MNLSVDANDGTPELGTVSAARVSIVCTNESDGPSTTGNIPCPKLLMRDLCQGPNASHYWQVVDEVFLKIVQVARSILHEQLRNAVQGEKSIDLLLNNGRLERVELTALVEHVRNHAVTRIIHTH